MNEFHHGQVSTEVDWFKAKLMPLMDGKPVMLTLLNESGIGKRKNPLITIVPGTYFGFRMKSVVVSVIDNGSCILDIDDDKTIGLIKAGIPAKHAKALLDVLKNIFNDEVNYGNSTPRYTKRPRAKKGTYTKFTHFYREGEQWHKGSRRYRKNAGRS